MKLSNRIRAIPDDAGNPWAIYERALEMRAQGIPVTMLSIGDHDTTTPEPIIAAMAASARGGHTGYAALSGTAELRRAIAARQPCAPEEVFVTPGGQFALFMALMATIDPGDAVVVLDPHYATYTITTRSAGGVLRTSPALPDAGFQPDFDALERALEGARVLLINSPNNPTGAVYPRATMNRIADLCTKHDTWLISDEVYAGQVWEGEHVSPRDLPGMAGRTITIGSMSKSHVMTGFRLGWLIAPAPLIASLRDLAISTTYGVSGFIQDAAADALRNGAGIEAEVTARYRRRRDIAVRALAGANAVRLAPPQGAMYVMLDIRATGLSGTDFGLSLLEAEHIAIMPGEGFGSAAAGHVRVSLTLPDADLEDALRRLAAHAASLAA